MANKRVYAAFAVEDEIKKNLFRAHAQNETIPYELIDNSVKAPGDAVWENACRETIKGCDGLIALISPKLKTAEGALWEINCAKEEKIPIVGIYIEGGPSFDKPKELQGVECKEWMWNNVKAFVNSL